MHSRTSGHPPKVRLALRSAGYCAAAFLWGPIWMFAFFHDDIRLQPRLPSAPFFYRLWVTGAIPQMFSMCIASLVAAAAIHRAIMSTKSERGIIGLGALIGPLTYLVWMVIEALLRCIVLLCRDWPRPSFLEIVPGLFWLSVGLVGAVFIFYAVWPAGIALIVVLKAIVKQCPSKTQTDAPKTAD